MLPVISDSFDKNRLKLALAYTECLSDMPSGKITVKAVTEKCGMTRQHFYRFFDDLDSLLYWYNAYHFLSVVGKYEYFEWEICIPETLEMIHDHKSFYCEAAKDHQNHRLKDILYKDIWILYNNILKYQLHGNVPGSMKKLLRLYCLGGVQMLYEWIREGMKEPVSEMTKLFHDGFPEKLQKIIMKPTPAYWLKERGGDMARLGAQEEYYMA